MVPTEFTDPQLHHISIQHYSFSMFQPCWTPFSFLSANSFQRNNQILIPAGRNVEAGPLLGWKSWECKTSPALGCVLLSSPNPCLQAAFLFLDITGGKKITCGKELLIFFCSYSLFTRYFLKHTFPIIQYGWFLLMLPIASQILPLLTTCLCITGLCRSNHYSQIYSITAPSLFLSQYL